MTRSGTVDGDLWITRVRLLRQGDVIQAQQWSGERWWGGEPLVVEDVRKIEPGWYAVVTVPADWPGAQTWQAFQEKWMRSDDEVVLVTREVKEKMASSDGKSETSSQVVGGPQLDLF